MYEEEKKYYAVKKGHNPGIYGEWSEVQKQIKGFSGPVFKKFFSEAEAQAYLDEVDSSEQEASTSETEVSIYTDGSFSPELKRYGWAYVVVKDGKKDTWRYGGASNPAYLQHRQIGGEIAAVLQGLNYAIFKGYKSVEICYDYEGIEKWATGKWKAKKPLTSAYRYYFEKKLKQVSVRFRKIVSHSGDPFNEEADRLAKIGANSYKKKGGKK